MPSPCAGLLENWPGTASGSTAGLSGMQFTGPGIRSKGLEAHRPVGGGCDPEQGPLELPPEADRPEPARLHRRDPGKDQHGTIARLGAEG